MADDNLTELLRQSAKRVSEMSPAEFEEMCRVQRDRYVRAEMSWPPAKFKWVNGAKVYDSYEDKLND